MDFHNMTRKELQGLCKKHNIKANTSNSQMVQSLAAFFEGLKTFEQAHEKLNAIAPSCLKGSTGSGNGDVEEISEGPDIRTRAKKKVTFQMQEDKFQIEDHMKTQKSPHERGLMQRRSSRRSVANIHTEEYLKDENSSKVVSKVPEILIRTTRSRALKSTEEVTAVVQPLVIEKRRKRKSVNHVCQDDEPPLVSFNSEDECNTRAGKGESISEETLPARRSLRHRVTIVREEKISRRTQKRKNVDAKEEDELVVGQFDKASVAGKLLNDEVVGSNEQYMQSQVTVFDGDQYKRKHDTSSREGEKLGKDKGVDNITSEILSKGALSPSVSQPLRRSRRNPSKGYVGLGENHLPVSAKKGKGNQRIASKFNNLENDVPLPPSGKSGDGDETFGIKKLHKQSKNLVPAVRGLQIPVESCEIGIERSQSVVQEKYEAISLLEGRPRLSRKTSKRESCIPADQKMITDEVIGRRKRNKRSRGTSSEGYMCVLETKADRKFEEVELQFNEDCTIGAQTELPVSNSKCRKSRRKVPGCEENAAESAKLQKPSKVELTESLIDFAPSYQNLEETNSKMEASQTVITDSDETEQLVKVNLDTSVASEKGNLCLGSTETHDPCINLFAAEKGAEMRSESNIQEKNKSEVQKSLLPANEAIHVYPGDNPQVHETEVLSKEMLEGGLEMNAFCTQNTANVCKIMRFAPRTVTSEAVSGGANFEGSKEPVMVRDVEVIAGSMVDCKELEQIKAFEDGFQIADATSPVAAPVLGNIMTASNRTDHSDDYKPDVTESTTHTSLESVSTVNLLPVEAETMSQTNLTEPSENGIVSEVVHIQSLSLIRVDDRDEVGISGSPLTGPPKYSRNETVISESVRGPMLSVQSSAEGCEVGYAIPASCFPKSSVNLSDMVTCGPMNEVSSPGQELVLHDDKEVTMELQHKDDSANHSQNKSELQFLDTPNKKIATSEVSSPGQELVLHDDKEVTMELQHKDDSANHSQNKSELQFLDTPIKKIATSEMSSPGQELVLHDDKEVTMELQHKDDSANHSQKKSELQFLDTVNKKIDMVTAKLHELYHVVSVERSNEVPENSEASGMGLTRNHSDNNGATTYMESGETDGSGCLVKTNSSVIEAHAVITDSDDVAGPSNKKHSSGYIESKDSSEESLGSALSNCSKNSLPMEGAVTMSQMGIRKPAKTEHVSGLIPDNQPDFDPHCFLPINITDNLGDDTGRYRKSSSKQLIDSVNEMMTSEPASMTILTTQLASEDCDVAACNIVNNKDQLTALTDAGRLDQIAQFAYDHQKEDSDKDQAGQSNTAATGLGKCVNLLDTLHSSTYKEGHFSQCIESRGDYSMASQSVVLASTGAVSSEACYVTDHGKQVDMANFIDYAVTPKFAVLDVKEIICKNGVAKGIADCYDSSYMEESMGLYNLFEQFSEDRETVSCKPKDTDHEDNYVENLELENLDTGNGVVGNSGKELLGEEGNAYSVLDSFDAEVETKCKDATPLQGTGDGNITLTLPETPNSQGCNQGEDPICEACEDKFNVQAMVQCAPEEHDWKCHTDYMKVPGKCRDLDPVNFMNYTGISEGTAFENIPLFNCTNEVAENEGLEKNKYMPCEEVEVIDASTNKYESVNHNEDEVEEEKDVNALLVKVNCDVKEDPNVDTNEETSMGEYMIGLFNEFEVESEKVGEWSDNARTCIEEFDQKNYEAASHVKYIPSEMEGFREKSSEAYASVDSCDTSIDVLEYQGEWNYSPKELDSSLDCKKESSPVEEKEMKKNDEDKNVEYESQNIEEFSMSHDTYDTSDVLEYQDSSLDCKKESSPVEEKEMKINAEDKNVEYAPQNIEEFSMSRDTYNTIDVLECQVSSLDCKKESSPVEEKEMKKNAEDNNVEYAFQHIEQFSMSHDTYNTRVHLHDFHLFVELPAKVPEWQGKNQDIQLPHMEAKGNEEANQFLSKGVTAMNTNDPVEVDMFNLAKTDSVEGHKEQGILVQEISLDTGTITINKENNQDSDSTGQDFSLTEDHERVTGELDGKETNSVFGHAVDSKTMEEVNIAGSAEKMYGTGKGQNVAEVENLENDQALDSSSPSSVLEELMCEGNSNIDAGLDPNCENSETWVGERHADVHLEVENTNTNPENSGFKLAEKDHHSIGFTAAKVPYSPVKLKSDSYNFECRGMQNDVLDAGDISRSSRTPSTPDKLIETFKQGSQLVDMKENMPILKEISTNYKAGKSVMSNSRRRALENLSNSSRR